MIKIYSGGGKYAKSLHQGLKTISKSFYNKDFDFFTFPTKTLKSEEDEYYSYHWHDYF